MRKTVTIVFSDLRGSTTLGERLDPEALHEVKERYFAAMAAEIKEDRTFKRPFSCSWGGETWRSTRC